MSDDLNIRNLISNKAAFDNLDNFDSVIVEKLIPFSEHPFKVRYDDKFDELVESIAENGVMYPIICRKIEDSNNFEILAGHRRTEAAKKAGLIEVPVRIVKVDDDTARLIVTESNLSQRDIILPSEKAKAYKMQMAIIKRQGKRTDLIKDMDELTLSHDGTKLNTGKDIAGRYKQGRSNIYRYVRLNELCDELLEMVDNEKLSLVSAVELSYLSNDEQNILLSVINEKDNFDISKETAEQLRELSKSSVFTENEVRDLLFPSKELTTEKKELPHAFSFKKVFNNAQKHFKDFAIDKPIDNNELESVIIQAIEEYLNDK